jgi:photosystem II stability/assembly factor-like uncharacterized protein
LTLAIYRCKIRHVSYACIKYYARFVTFCTFVLLLLFAGTGIFPSPKAAAAAEKWTAVNIPAEGAAGGWTLAAGTDLKHLTAAADGTLYAYANGPSNTLYKSADGGLKWTSLTQAAGEITGIAASPANAGTVYYATAGAIYRTTNAGGGFVRLPDLPGGTGSANLTISSIDVACLSHDVIAAGVKNANSGLYGAVYVMEDDGTYQWTDTGIGAYDVLTVAFSPNYTVDRQLTAVATDETDTWVMNRIGNSNWNAFIGRAKLDKDNSGLPSPIAACGASLVFPGNYNAMTAGPGRILYAGVATGSGSGDLYRITLTDSPGLSTAQDLNIGAVYGQNDVDIGAAGGFSAGGKFYLAAGDAASSMVYTSADGGTTWSQCVKAPTGTGVTSIVPANDYATSGKIYAATSGPNSALSLSRDLGQTWNQISFIDTAITTMLDLAISPNYNLDKTFFLVTHSGASSLWRTLDGGTTWERVLTSGSAGIDAINKVILPPQYGTAGFKVITAGLLNGQPAVWESTNNGQDFKGRPTHSPATGAAFNIDTWAMPDDNTLFIGSYDGVHGLIYRTNNSGFFYQGPVAVGNNPLTSIALSPDYAADGVILAGNGNGGVFISNDRGTSFQPLPASGTAPLPAGDVNVAFSADFSTSHIVFAASQISGGGIFRFNTVENQGWENIGGSLPGGATLGQIRCSGDGILYVVDSHTGNGVERCLNPGNESPDFEQLNTGFNTGAVLSGLQQNGRRLWTIDGFNCKVMTYEDTLTLAAAPSAPKNMATSIGNAVNHVIKNVTLDWDPLTGATSYEWQCCASADFSVIPNGFNGTTSGSSVQLPPLDPATTYYWRVRAKTPALGPWSVKWSFTTCLDSEIIALKPESPAAGEKAAPLKPVFQWTAVVGATSYDLLVAGNIDFIRPVIVKVDDFALPTNVWQCDVTLDANTTYYWKVRATARSTSTAWSSTGVFTTAPPPEKTTTPVTATPDLKDTLTPLSAKSSETLPVKTTEALPLPPAPSPATQTGASAQNNSYPFNIPPWLGWFIGGLILIVVLALIIVLAVVLKIKRVG